MRVLPQSRSASTSVCRFSLLRNVSLLRNEHSRALPGRSGQPSGHSITSQAKPPTAIVRCLSWQPRQLAAPSSEICCSVPVSEVLRMNTFTAAHRKVSFTPQISQPPVVETPACIVNVVNLRPVGKPCPACAELLKHDVHQLKRKGTRAAFRYENAARNIIPALRHVSIRELGHLELVAHLEATLSELEVCQSRNVQLTRDVDQLTVKMLGCAAHDFKLEGSALEQLLLGIAKSIHTARRRFSSAEVQFYTTLLNLGGPLVFKFVSDNLNGPCLRTVRGARASSAYFRLDSVDENVQQGLQVFSKYNTSEIPIMICEDASAATPRLDVAHRDGRYFVYGMCGGVVEVKSVEQLQDELLKRGLAKSLYVHVMVPMAPHAGFLPALCTASDNTDGSVELLRKMMEVDEALHGAGGVAMGHCGDGAAAYRKAIKDVASFTFVHRDDVPAGSLVVDHPIMEMFAPFCSGGSKLMTIDWMHVGWRLRRAFLHPTKQLLIGPYMIDPSVLITLSKDTQRKGKVQLLASDLDYNDKQNQAATMKLADLGMDPKTGVVQLKTTLRDTLADVGRSEAGGEGPTADGTVYGTWLYLEFMHNYMSIFNVEMTPKDAIERAAFILVFIGHWETALRKAAAKNPKLGATLKDNFLTSETKQDVIITMNNVILMAKYMRDFCVRNKVLVKCDFGRLSSRFAEYCFQALRCADKTSCVFGFKRAEELIRIFISQLENEVDTDWSIPASKRGVSRGKSKTFSPEAEGVGVHKAIFGYYPDDAGIQEAINKGLHRAQHTLEMDVGPVTGGTPRPGSVWEYVTATVRSVPYGPNRMRLLADVSIGPPPLGQSARSESVAGQADAEYGNEEMDEEQAEFQDTGAADFTTNTDDEDDTARGRGMVLHPQLGDIDKDEEECGKSSNAVAKGKKRGTHSGRLSRLMSALLEFCRLVNAFIARQPRDRVNGRFWTTSEEFRDALSMLTDADQDHLSDGDCVAVLAADRGRTVVRGHNKAKQALRRIRRLDINDPNGRVRLRLLSAADKDENGRLKYLMPHALAHSANALWETNNIVQLVYMLPGRDDPSGGQYIMHEDDEKALRDYCETHKFVLDEKGACWGGGRAVQAPIQASLAPGGLVPMSTPKPGQPRQRKLELRVDSAARGDVAAALGQQTKSGRILQPTRRALGED
ncbi:hypothetical protein VOLCADRAFT_105344 [Volvox carteri f. nagariensis]|uniref:Uncharacterized protein n=1 Tax=Volvox carteri f. nagariensis TaxID=3068 RepID=D8U090_VOLCA|nr:uncharacterized protein VOLCADRAFT_105344 [Volvox carteri f. nagariensis]EFJ46900.1 hypothetical protein VOLCADRAFT_105344 [Volvox carteri f. nagariensis]|eukprot:XP_002952109.1 hypothetical protein VOLCADRAFT_105344 [Volvox carteri f. nagariensis]